MRDTRALIWLLLTCLSALSFGVWLSRQPATAAFHVQSSPLHPTPTRSLRPSPPPTLRPTPTPPPPATSSPTATHPRPTVSPPHPVTPTPRRIVRPTNPLPPPPSTGQGQMGPTPTPLLQAYTPIPTYAPPLYIPQPNEVRPGPTEVVTPWPTPASLDRKDQPWRTYVPYVHYDWAYTYPFLRSRFRPTPAPQPRRDPLRRLTSTLSILLRILPSFVCLGFAFFLAAVEALALILNSRRHERR